MEKTIEIEIPLLLPGVQDDKDACLNRLEASLQNHRGILRAHLERDQSPVDLCLHYDPNLLSLPDVKRIAERAGAELSNRYYHANIPIEGMDCSDCSLVIEHSIGRLDGVLSVNVNYPAERMWVEFDNQKINRTAIEKRVRSLGYEIPLNEFQERLHENRELMFSLLSGMFLLIGGSERCFLVPPCSARFSLLHMFWRLMSRSTPGTRFGKDILIQTVL
jgi:Cd2+/Zn2+-exporting ATPase